MRWYTFVLSAIVTLISVISSVQGGGKNGSGCKNGFCWAYCSPFVDMWDWCYTTGGSNQDSKGYAKCTGTSAVTTAGWQCHPNWKCNGACTI